MRILVVSHLFAPSNAIGSVRITKFARFLREAGHEVRVLAARDVTLPQDLGVEVPASAVTYVDPAPSLQLVRKALSGYEATYRSGESKIHPFLAWGLRTYRAMTQVPDAQYRWCRPATEAGSRIIQEWRPDLIFSSALPISSLVVASRLARRHGIRMVAELRDLWTDSHYYSMPFWRRLIDVAIEKRCLRPAEFLVTVSEPLAEVLRAKYGKPVLVTLNGFDPADFPQVRAGEFRRDDPLRIVYTGLVYPNRQRDPSPLFAALGRMNASPGDFQVQFVGRLLSEVRVIAREHGVEQLVVTSPAMPYRRSLELQANADLLLLLLWNSPEERGVYSGKLFEYLGARRPILLVGPLDGVAADLIRTRSAGAVLNDPDAIAAYLWERLAEKRATGCVAPLPDDVGRGLTRREQFLALESAIRHGPPQPAGRRLRIMVVCDRLDIGGTERHLAQVLPKIDRTRYEVQLFALRPGGALEKEIADAGVSIASARYRHLGIAGALAGFVRELARQRPQAVHFFLPRAYLLAGSVAAALGHGNLIMSRRSLNDYSAKHPFAWRVEKILHRQMRCLVGNSSAVVEQLRDESGGRVPVSLLYNGIDPPIKAEMSREEARSTTGLAADIPVILMVANLIPYKGHADLLDALAILSSEGCNRFLAVCVGRDQGILNTLRAQATRLGLESRVRWVGEQSDVWPWWRSADIGVLCSHEEGFANVILEGMAARVPMVVTDVGGNPEAVIDGITGLVVPARSPVRLAAAIRQLVEHSDMRRRLADSAVERVRSEFSLAKCVLSYEALYSRVAS